MSWFSELNTVEKRTFYSAFGGWALDALDFMVFTFVIASLMTLWHTVSYTHLTLPTKRIV